MFSRAICFIALLIWSFHTSAQDLSPNDSIRLNLKEVTEVKPRFPGCEDLGLNQKELDTCAAEELFIYFFDHLVYPEEAIKERVQGNVVISWTIESDGTLTNEHILRDIGAGCGQAALKIISDMRNDNIIWIPGIQNNKKVPVQYYMPVRFSVGPKMKKKKRKRKKKKQN